MPTATVMAGAIARSWLNATRRANSVGRSGGALADFPMAEMGCIKISSGCLIHDIYVKELFTIQQKPFGL